MKSEIQINRKENELEMRVLVNCALPYANSSLHLGHIAGCYLGGDIFVRYNRMMGNSVLFVSGTDEYGTPITIKAESENTTPQAVADKYHREIQESFNAMDIKFDIFSRTTYQEHTEFVGEIFLDLLNKGYLSEHEMVSPYCKECNRFLPDRYVTGTCPYCGYDKARGDQCDNCGKTLDPKDLISPICIISGTTPEFRETRHFFFRLDLFQKDLLEWVSERKNWRSNVLSFTKNFIESGLKERPITRDLTWGVPIPLKGYEDKRIYVWFEALLGYISAAKIYSKSIGEPDYWKQFWTGDTRSYFFLGKDNIPFHSVMLPAILMGNGKLNLPYDIPANEYLKYNGEKFSKSRGVGFLVDEMLKVADKDYIRFYIASILPENGDSEFSVTEMEDKVNAELISKYGNLIHRLTSFVHNNGISLSYPENPLGKDLEILRKAYSLFDEYKNYMQNVEVKKALKTWIDLVQSANAYFNESEPWKLLKIDPVGCAEKLSIIYVISSYLTVMIYPIIPSSASRIWKNLGRTSLIEKNGVEDLSYKFGNLNLEKASPPFVPLKIPNDNPNSLDLRVGKILSIRDHPSADRLYLLEVDLGDRKIHLVAGLRSHYKPEELVSRNIVVVSNLKKARIRGETSEGMLLAADDGTVTSFITLPDNVKPGTSVDLGEYSFNGQNMVEIDDLSKFNLHVSRVDGDIRAFASIDGTDLPLNANGILAFPEKNVKDGAKIR
jgi:methionyl-tRNA synthetase